MEGYVRIREIGKGAMGCATLVERRIDGQQVLSSSDHSPVEGWETILGSAELSRRALGSRW